MKNECIDRPILPGSLDMPHGLIDTNKHTTTIKSTISPLTSAAEISSRVFKRRHKSMSLIIEAVEVDIYLPLLQTRANTMMTHVNRNKDVSPVSDEPPQQIKSKAAVNHGSAKGGRVARILLGTILTSKIISVMDETSKMPDHS